MPRDHHPARGRCAQINLLCSRREDQGRLLAVQVGALTVREVDDLSDAFAAGLLDNGFVPGDRLAVYLQNVPQFVLTMLATWKAGGTPLPVASRMPPLTDAVASRWRSCSPA